MEKKYKKIMKEINRTNKKNLKSYKKIKGITAVRILPAGDACDICKAWKDKKIPLKEALKNPSLPIKGCQGKYGYCRCVYIAVFDEK